MNAGPAMRAGRGGLTARKRRRRGGRRCQLGWGSAGSGRAGARWAGCRWYGSGCGSQSGDLVPDGESSGHFGAIIVSGEAMAAGPEVRRDPIRRLLRLHEVVHNTLRRNRTR